MSNPKLEALIIRYIKNDNLEGSFSGLDAIESTLEVIGKQLVFIEAIINCFDKYGIIDYFASKAEREGYSRGDFDEAAFNDLWQEIEFRDNAREMLMTRLETNEVRQAFYRVVRTRIEN